MRRLYLSDCKAGDVVDDVFVVTNTQLAASSNGKHYIKAFVSDRTAQLTSRLWSATRETFAALPENAFVRIRGRVENYQNNLQLIIEQFGPPQPGTFEIGDLLPATTKDIDAMCQRVFEILSTLRHTETKAIIQAFLDDEDLMNNFARAPAASSFHHAFIGGLLEHTLSLLEITDRLLPLYPGLSRDLCLAGVFLHDVAKTWELSYETAFNYTVGGQLIGHIVKAAMMIEEKAATAGRTMGRPIPKELVEVLQHIVLSHHEKLEHGSPKPPQTPEAIFVSLVDNLDAKVSMGLAAARTNPTPAPENATWTEFLKPFGYRLYRPDPTAPPVASSGNAEPLRPPEPVRGHDERSDAPRAGNAFRNQPNLSAARPSANAGSAAPNHSAGSAPSRGAPSVAPVPRVPVATGVPASGSGGLLRNPIATPTGPQSHPTPVRVPPPPSAPTHASNGLAVTARNGDNGAAMAGQSEVSGSLFSPPVAPSVPAPPKKPETPPEGAAPGKSLAITNPFFEPTPPRKR